MYLLKDLDLGRNHLLKNVHAIGKSDIGLIPSHQQRILDDYPEVKKYNLALDKGKPQFLIGLDHEDLIAASEV